MLHIEECHLLPDWIETKLLVKNVTKQTRKVLEAGHILTRNTFNSRGDSSHGHRCQQNWRWASQTRDFTYNILDGFWMLRLSTESFFRPRRSRLLGIESSVCNIPISLYFVEFSVIHHQSDRYSHHFN